MSIFIEGNAGSGVLQQAGIYQINDALFAATMTGGTAYVGSALASSFVGP